MVLGVGTLLQPGDLGQHSRCVRACHDSGVALQRWVVCGLIYTQVLQGRFRKDDKVGERERGSYSVRLALIQTHDHHGCQT